MHSSARIQVELDRSAAMDVAMVVPAVATSLETIDTVHTVADSFSSEAAAQIPLGEEASLLRKITLGLAPLFLAFGWVAFFKAFKQLWQAPDRTFEHWMNAGVSFIAAAGATIGTAFLLGGLAYVAPYLFAAILGLNALQGLYYTAKSLMLAYKDPAQRWKHLKEAGKQFLGIATNTLAMVLNLLVFQAAELIAGGIKEFASSLFSLFMHFEELVNFVNGPVTSAVLNIRGVGLGWLGAFALGLIASAVKINKESWYLIQGSRPNMPTFEREAFSDIKQILKVISDRNEPFAKRLFLALTAPITIPLYAATAFIYTTLVRPLAALTLGIPQVLVLGLYYGAKKLFSSPATEAQPSPVLREDRVASVPLVNQAELRVQTEREMAIVRSRKSSQQEMSYSPAQFTAPQVQQSPVTRSHTDTDLDHHELGSKLVPHSC
jgi:hypothetical protein